MQPVQRATEQYDNAYSREDYYWSKTPSSLCFEILRRLPPTRPLKVLDIGCGEGRNAVFLARNGYEVHAFDLSELGIQKTNALAEEAGTSVQAFVADLSSYRPDQSFDILFSTGVLHCLPPETRDDWFDHFKRHTRPGGIHVLSVFVTKPFIPPSPDADPNGSEWRSGELLGKYHDWRVEWSIEEVFDCMSSGVPHQHCVNRVIARMPEA